jgi:hypothetical protein
MTTNVKITNQPENKHDISVNCPQGLCILKPGEDLITYVYGNTVVSVIESMTDAPEGKV